ncbi:MAG: hypothetical protein HQK51_03290 [Oligoflexia bacterium]|nr:hypothetical protein [Oligoflexia bacterium]
MNKKERILIVSRFLGEITYRSIIPRSMPMSKNVKMKGFKFHFKGYYKGEKINEIILFNSSKYSNNFIIGEDYLLNVDVFRIDEERILLGIILEFKNINLIHLF